MRRIVAGPGHRGGHHDVERWVGPMAGLAGAVVTGAGLALCDISGPEAVNPDATAATIASAVAALRGQVQAGSVVLMVGLFLLVWFMVHLRQRLDTSDATRWMASTASAAGLITITLMALVGAYVRASVETMFVGAEALIPKGIVVLDWDYWRTFAPFISAHLVGAGGVLIGTSGPSRVLGCAAVAAAALPLVLPPGLMTIVFLLWLAVLSTALLVRPTAIAQPEASAPRRIPPV